MSTQHLTLLTFNLWHGLNHNYPKLMLPAETWSDKLKRDRYVLDALRKAQSTGPFIAAFQELNPVQKKLKAITNALNMNGMAAEGNVGIRVGALSYPFLLQ